MFKTVCGSTKRISECREGLKSTLAEFYARKVVCKVFLHFSTGNDLANAGFLKAEKCITGRYSGNVKAK